MLTMVKVNNIDVTAYVINYAIERTYGDAVSVCSIKLSKTVSAVLTPVTGQTVEIWRGWTTSTDQKIFSGYMVTYNPEGGVLTISANDELWKAVTSQVVKAYQSTDSFAGKISAIFQDLVTTYAGLNADSGTIQDSGTTVILDKFICNYANVMDRLTALATALNWQFYYRADTDKVYFEPKGYATNTTILTVGTNVQTIPRWEYDNSELCNDLTVFGASVNVQTTESGRIGTTTGYTTTSIQLQNVPNSVKMYMDASNPPTTLRIGGVPESSGSYFYWVDKTNAQLKPEIGTTFTTGHYAQNQYTYSVPVPVNIYSQSSINSYGRFAKKMTYTDIRSVDDAEARCSNYLLTYSQPFTNATLRVTPVVGNNFFAGQLIRVVDAKSFPTVDTFLNITRHVINYPANFEEVVVGDKIWRLAQWSSDVMLGLKQLLDDETNNEGILTQLISIDQTSTPLVVNPRYVWFKTQTLGSSGNAFILGHTTYGKLGAGGGTLGDSRFGAETNYFIQQYNNTYEEMFVDNDFKGTTTATWDTTNHRLDFTSGQYATSLSIDYNNSTITTATLTATVTSGTFTYQLSANGGSNWENCTNGVAHAFTNTGTSLMWKITESATSTGRITEVDVTNYH